MRKLGRSYKLFYTIIVLFLLFVCCFVLYQHSRERSFRVDLLQSQLQDFNQQVCFALQDGNISMPNKQQRAWLNRLVGRQEKDGLRLTLINTDGRVVYDSFNDNIHIYGNHLDRPEIRQALGLGTGFDVRRLSKTFGKPYFYSATYNSPLQLVVRSALPYNTELTHSLRTDKEYLWFATFITVVLIFIFYYVIHKMRSSISQKENLLTHLRISREGLAVFDANRELILSNSLFNQYGNIVSDTLLSHEEDILDVKEFSPLLTFLEQYTKRSLIGDEPSTSVTIEKEGRVLLATCVIFFDHSFEISINDITQMEEQTRLKHQLTQNIAHELKTPVSSIRGYIETMMEQGDKLDCEKRQHFMERCYAQSDRLSHLLQDISTLNMMDNKKNVSKREAVDISLMVSGILNDVALSLEQQQMTVSNLLPDNLILDGDRSLLYSIFRNLTDNAIAYAGEGSTIVIRMFRADSEFYYFSFADNGVGVADQHLSRIFERFYRVDKGRSRKMGGTGLGLAIVKNAVIMHGGTISAKRSIGGGLEFIFTLKKGETILNVKKDNHDGTSKE
jgi:signal transduction histidine kinase